MFKFTLQATPIAQPPANNLSLHDRLNIIMIFNYYDLYMIYIYMLLHVAKCIFEQIFTKAQSQGICIEHRNPLSNLMSHGVCTMFTNGILIGEKNVLFVH